MLVMILAFAMDAPRIADGGDAAAGAPFNGWLVPNTYLRLVVGLWALMSVLVIGIAGLLGGRQALRGLLPATLAAIAGGSVALAAADLRAGRGRGHRHGTRRAGHRPGRGSSAPP